MNLKRSFQLVCLTALIVIILLPVRMSSQDVHFSQAGMTPLNLNPAQTGAQYNLRALINYKNQWGTVAAPYQTANFSFDARIGKNKSKKGFSAFGLQVFSDKAGDAEMGLFQANLSYAYHVSLNEKSTLGAGFVGGFSQRSLKYAAFQWGNQYDGVDFNASLPTGEPVGSDNISLADLGAGIHYEYGKEQRYMTGNDQKTISVGFSAFHLNQPKYSFYKTDEKLPIKMVGYASALFGISNSQLSIEPSVYYFRQSTQSELLFGARFRYQMREESKYTGYVKGSAISLGTYYRNKDAFITTFLFEISQYAIGVSYDLNVSDLKTASAGKGGIEFSIRFLSPNPFLSKSASSF